jgi:hypothetical protein
LLNDPHRKLKSEVAAAMAIKARQWIHEIRRISDDKVKMALDARVKIALNNLYVRDAIEGRIKLAKPQCTPVDIAKGNGRCERRR